jgi:L-lactate dehydrogenase (cytochrome)
MKLRELAPLVHVGRPPAPYGARRLARCFSIEDLARAARRRLPAAAIGYLDGGGEDEYTLRRNRAAFDDIEIVPHVLHDVSDVDTTTELLGASVPAPIALAPVGAPRLFHHEGELAVARAAGAAGVPYAIGTLATVSLGDAANASDGGALWFQLYAWGDRGVAKHLVSRAAELGCRALLVSVDVTVRSKRERELRAGVTLPTPHLTPRAILDGARHPSWSWHFATSDVISFPNITGDARDVPPLESMFDGTVTWNDLDWIRELWPGPLALKGVLSVSDATRAADLGVDAVIVSNHGGRQLDHVPATIDVLPAIADAVGDRVEVIVDGGIRRGTDVLAALASGARGVLIGRAYLYGLAAAGEPGVRHAIDILTTELRTAMALAGCRTLEAVDATVIRRDAARTGTDPTERYCPS